MGKKLPGLLVNSYGFANFSFSLMMFLALNYYAIFLTDVALINAAHVGTIMLITHLVDAVAIFASGIMIQRSQMRWGQFRSWLIFTPILTCIFFTLTFTNLPLSYGRKMVYLALAYMIAHISLNFAFNAQLGLISVLTKDVKERLKLATRNIQFGMASQVLFSLAVIPMLLFFSRKSATWGYFYTVLILAVIQVLGYWNLFFRSKGYEKYDPSKKLDASNKLTIPEMVRQVFGNRQLLLLIGGDTAVSLGLFSITTLTVYYFKYVTQNVAWMSPFTLFMGIFTFLSAAIAPMAANKLGKKNTYLLAAVWYIIGNIALRLFGASSPYIYIAICGLTALIGAMGFSIRQAMYMDTAEYGHYKSGKDASAFIMSMYTLPVKIGIALATTIAGYGLAMIGYIPDIAPTDQFIGNLMNLISFVPAGCGILAFLIMLFYSLSDDKLTIYMETNSKRKAEAMA